MLNKEIYIETFRFPVKKLMKNIFQDTQESLEFLALSKCIFYRQHNDW